MTALRPHARTALASFLACLLAFALSGGAPPQDSPSHRDCLGACHKTHNAAKDEVLGKGPTLDATCLSCHLGKDPTFLGGKAAQLKDWRGRRSAHISQDPTRRDPNAYGRTVQGNRKRIALRYDCSGCHDPHLENGGPLRKDAFSESGALISARPSSAAEVCFGCHAGQQSTPLKDSPEVRDLGRLFMAGNPSRHAIGKTAKDRPDLPSLRGTPFTGRLDCTSCHDEPDGTAPRGPHSSPYKALLKAPFGREMDGMAEETDKLCYLCHMRESIEADQSFPLHLEHISGFAQGMPPGGGSRDPVFDPHRGPRSESLGVPRDLRRSSLVRPRMEGYGQPTPCATCHDSHGSTLNPALIRFDTAVVRPTKLGGPTYRRMGLLHGSCTLTCHGHEHLDSEY